MTVMCYQVTHFGSTPVGVCLWALWGKRWFCCKVHRWTPFSHFAFHSYRGGIWLYGGSAHFLLRASSSRSAAAGDHGAPQLQPWPIPTGPHPATDAWRPHEPLRLASHTTGSVLCLRLLFSSYLFCIWLVLFYIIVTSSEVIKYGIFVQNVSIFAN